MQTFWPQNIFICDCIFFYFLSFLSFRFFPFAILFSFCKTIYKWYYTIYRTAKRVVLFECDARCPMAFTWSLRRLYKMGDGGGTLCSRLDLAWQSLRIFVLRIAASIRYRTVGQRGPRVSEPSDGNEVWSTALAATLDAATATLAATRRLLSRSRNVNYSRSFFDTWSTIGGVLAAFLATF